MTKSYNPCHTSNVRGTYPESSFHRKARKSEPLMFPVVLENCIIYPKFNGRKDLKSQCFFQDAPTDSTFIQLEIPKFIDLITSG